MSKHGNNDKIIVRLLSGQSLTKHELEEAGRILYEDYVPMADAYLRVRVGIHSQLLREEILLETLERVTRSIRKFDPSRSKFTTFFIGFARLVAFEMLRNEFEMIGLKEFNEKDILEPAESPKDTKALLHDLLHGRYAACFESLDPKYRTLIEMEFEGMPPEIYMKRYGVNRPAYRKRKQRGLKELRERISLMGPNTRQG